MNMVNNIDSIYAKILGEFKEPLQNMIKHLYELTVTHKEKDVIWLIKNFMRVSIGIELLGNKRVNYFSAL